MKKLLIIAALTVISSNLFGQNGSIRIFTDLEEESSWIMAWINDEPQDAAFSDEVIVEGLYSGKYKLQVSFNSDTIADWEKEIKLDRNEQVEYKVVAMKDFGKEVGKMGRGFGKKTGRTEGSDESLVQYYKLEKVKKD